MTDYKKTLSDHIQREEKGRLYWNLFHPWPCVPWLGCGGELGKCIYCGKSVCCN